MKIREEIIFELSHDDRIYRFSMPKAAPVGEIYDICFKVLQKSVELAQASLDSAKKELARKSSDDTEAGG